MLNAAPKGSCSSVQQGSFWALTELEHKHNCVAQILIKCIGRVGGNQFYSCSFDFEQEFLVNMGFLGFDKF